MTTATSGTPIADANLALESKMAVASPRSLLGNHTPMALAFPGKVGASAMPSNTRSKKLTITPTPRSRAIRQRRLVHNVGDGSACVKGARWFRDSRTQQGGFKLHVSVTRKPNERLMQTRHRI